jgi:hypothetical protein
MRLVTLIFLCFSVSARAQAFKPKVFLGYDPTVEGWATARFSKYLFEHMVHHGYSVQEAWDRLKHMTEGAYVVYLENSILSGEMPRSNSPRSGITPPSQPLM